MWISIELVKQKFYQSENEIRKLPLLLYILNEKERKKEQWGGKKNSGKPTGLSRLLFCLSIV